MIWNWILCTHHHSPVLQTTMLDKGSGSFRYYFGLSGRNNAPCHIVSGGIGNGRLFLQRTSMWWRWVNTRSIAALRPRLSVSSTPYKFCWPSTRMAQHCCSRGRLQKRWWRLRSARGRDIVGRTLMRLCRLVWILMQASLIVIRRSI